MSAAVSRQYELPFSRLRQFAATVGMLSVPELVRLALRMGSPNVQ
jgi:hypothetical protein